MTVKQVKTVKSTGAVIVDKFDQLIIAELKRNARQSISNIAEAVSLSRSAVAERIKKLEQNSTIKGYQVLLSESQKEGVSAYLEIQHRCPRCADVVHIFQAIECPAVAVWS